MITLVNKDTTLFSKESAIEPSTYDNIKGYKACVQTKDRREHNNSNLKLQSTFHPLKFIRSYRYVQDV